MRNIFDEVINESIQNPICNHDRPVNSIGSENSLKHMDDKFIDKTISSWKAKYPWLVIVRAGKEIRNNPKKEITHILGKVLESDSKSSQQKGVHIEVDRQFNDLFQNSER